MGYKRWKKIYTFAVAFVLGFFLLTRNHFSFQVPILKENGLNVQGYISIAKHITRTSKQHALLGKWCLIWNLFEPGKLCQLK